MRIAQLFRGERESLVSPWFSVFVDESGRQQFRCTVGTDSDLPLIRLIDGSGFDDPVVVGTQQHRIAEVGASTGPPGLDVVALADRWRCVAARQHAALVP